MSTHSQALETALGHHQAGRLAQAAEVYRAILRAEPRHAAALHLLGLIEHQSGHHDSAVQLITSAIRADPGQAIFHNNLGEVYRVDGMFAEAEACYRTAIDMDPSTPQPYYNLARVERARGDAAATAERCRQAIAIEPDYVAAQYLLAAALWALGDVSGSLAGYERVVAIDPRHADALTTLGTLLRDQGDFERAGMYLEQALTLRPDSADVHVRFGDVRSHQRDWPRAIACYEAAVRLDQQSPVAETHLAAALRASGVLAAAVAHFRRALELQPDNVTASYNLASALEAQGDADAAAEQYRRTLQLDPGFANAHLQLGAYYQATGQFRRALEHYDEALAIEPDSPKAHFNRGFILLLEGRLAEGWQEFEWRLRVPDFPVRHFAWPPWDGSPIASQTLLIHSEQGLGDTLQLVRYLAWARPRAGRVVTLVHPPLVPLLRCSGYQDVLADEQSLPKIDFQIPMMSLPRVAGTTLQNIPAEIPYLSADPRLAAEWRQRLRGMTGFRVGICWQGSPTFSADHLRSIPLQAFAPLARVPGVRLVSLQKVAGLEQLDAVSGQFEVLDLRPEYDVEEGAFMNAAAVMRNLDLVVTIDTAIAHLAGALGVPVWVALAERNDWRWLLGRDDSPWYPSMRLFRQRKAGDWTELFECMAVELRRQIAAQASPASTP